MINLIPPSAKKTVTKEYWLRVLTVWFYVCSAALFSGVLIMLPSYVLITSQVQVYQESASNASQKVASYEDVSKNLSSTNQQSGKLITAFRRTLVSDRIEILRQLQNPGIVLSAISVSRTDDTYEPIRISGIANDRQALAAFRDRLLAQEDVASVDLPLSNLAKDREIPFSLTVVLKKQTP